MTPKFRRSAKGAVDGVEDTGGAMGEGGAVGATGQGGGLRQARSELARGASLPQALLAAATAGAGATSIVRLSTELRADVEGAGPVLQPLLETPGVTDVLVGGGHTWIDRGQGLEEVPGAALAEPQVRALAVRMAASAGRRLDEASPVVDATMPDGTRLNAVLPPLSGDGTLICLRTSRRRAFTLAELRKAGTVPAGLDQVLAALVEQHASCLITGATGTGKTTLLAALLGLVSPTERIVCIEEASELRPNHPHVIHLQERGENVEGVGAVPMSSLVRTAMRMRPDRIVLGECRGPEVREVLSALNTGHEGGWATLHANSPADVPARLTALGALAGMSEHMVNAQAASALDAVVHLRRLAGGLRVVQSVGLLSRCDGELVCQEALVRGPAGYGAGTAVAGLAERIGQAPVQAALTQQLVLPATPPVPLPLMAAPASPSPPREPLAPPPPPSQVFSQAPPASVPSPPPPPLPPSASGPADLGHAHA